jgi:hypothetical protein
MKAGTRQRWIVLVVLLTLTLTAAAWVRDSDKSAPVADVVEAPARAARPARAAAPAPAAAERVALDRLQSHRLELNRANPFETRSWKPPVVRNAAPAVAAPPPTPTAPPLPFVYLGKLVSEEQDAVFLVMGERNLVVHRGDVIDSTYRVDNLAETKVVLTHLPTGLRQTLMIGEPQ